MAKVARKKAKRTVSSGEVCILASFNNTLVSITDSQGNVIAWATAGGSGFKGSRKSTPYAAQMAAKQAAQKAKEFGLRTVKIKIRGPGPGGESAARAIGETFSVTFMEYVGGTPHNGCRPEKERRV
jgi:small subunit ribosomal protein S11